MSEETTQEMTLRIEAECEARNAAPKFAFRHSRVISGTSLYHCPAQGQDIYVNLVATVPEGDEATINHPLVKEYMAKGFIFVGIVTRWVKSFPDCGKTMPDLKYLSEPWGPSQRALARRAKRKTARIEPQGLAKFQSSAKFGHRGRKL